MTALARRTWSPLTRWIVICCAVCIALRLPFISAALGVDEGGDAFIARAWATTHGSLYGSYWVDRSPVLLGVYRAALACGGVIGVRVLGAVAALFVVIASMTIARLIGDVRAARNAGLLAATFTASLLTGGVFTAAELLAAVPSATALLCLLLAGRSSPGRRLIWFAVAGLMASLALLLKQSFLDFGAASVCFLAVGAFLPAYRFRWKEVVSWTLPFALPITAVMIWAHRFSIGAGHLVYALLGFRLDGLATIGSGNHSSPLLHTGLPLAFASGAALLLPWAALQLWQRRSDALVTATLSVWLVAGIFGIAGGGNYYPHYFLELAPSLSVLGGAALANSRGRIVARVTYVTFGALAAATMTVGLILQHHNPPQQRTVAVAQFLKTSARRKDSMYVMYARANLLYYAGLRDSYPYAWALMIRTLPGAEDQLRMLLNSQSRPTWIVEWQPPTMWGLDRSGATRRALKTYYRSVATVCGKPVLLRKDVRRQDAPLPSRSSCGSLAIPSNVVDFVDGHGTSADSADYIWQ